MDERAYLFWLANVLEIGAVTLRRLFNHFNSARAVYEAPPKDLMGLFKIPQSKAEVIIAHRDKWKLAGEWEDFLRKGIGFVTIGDDNYPKRLKNIYDPPFALFYIGELPDDDKKTVAIVGARECTPYGKEAAYRMGANFARADTVVISGLARGVDSYGHKGALSEGGKTYGVLGCGVNIVYPPENGELYKEIAKTGGVISEFPPDSPPVQKGFPMRNRIIAGLSQAVYVVEAREKSGSLITADLALEQGRDVYALPGRVTDKLSSGCNKLIRQGAGIITSVDEVVSDIENVPGLQAKLESLSREESMVYNTLSLHPKGFGTIADETGIDPVRLFEIVESLEDLGRIKEQYNNHYIIQ